MTPTTRMPVLPALPFDLAAIPRITFSACGSAYYAGLTAEILAGEPGPACRSMPMWPANSATVRRRCEQAGLGLLVSQSGETADTLAALRYMRGEGQKILSILNVPESTMARESDAMLETIAGPEIGVASTKAFTAQLTVMAVFALAWRGRAARCRSGDRAAGGMRCWKFPAKAAEILAQ